MAQWLECLPDNHRAPFQSPEHIEMPDGYGHLSVILKLPALEGGSRRFPA